MYTLSSSASDSVVNYGYISRAIWMYLFSMSVWMMVLVSSGRAKKSDIKCLPSCLLAFSSLLSSKRKMRSNLLISDPSMFRFCTTVFFGLYLESMGFAAAKTAV